MKRWTGHLLLSIALLSGAYMPRHSAGEPVLRLPIRFHLLASPTSTALATTRTEEDAAELLRVANSVWRQAGIEWYIESVIREESPGGAAFDSLLAGTIPRTEHNLTAFVPRDRLLVPGWNVFLIRDFGDIAGGTYRPGLGIVILAERGFGFELPVTGRGGGTLAHELGHSLTLGHEPCDSTHDIMANACWSPTTPSTLTPEQIARARRQAMEGRPTSALAYP